MTSAPLFPCEVYKLKKGEGAPRAQPGCRRSSIEELDLDLDPDELDDVEELDLAEKGLESVPACIFTLTTATTLALESESRAACCLFSLCFACSLSVHHSSARVSMPCVSDAARARGGEEGRHSMPCSAPSRASCTTARAWRGTLPPFLSLHPNLVWHVSPPHTPTPAIT